MNDRFSKMTVPFANGPRTIYTYNASANPMYWDEYYDVMVSHGIIYYRKNGGTWGDTAERIHIEIAKRYKLL